LSVYDLVKKADHILQFTKIIWVVTNCRWDNCKRLTQKKTHQKMSLAVLVTDVCKEAR